ncbi:MAG: hypothetical protein KIT25_15310 [Enhydrobacter sp.]|nr:MAG: hypothetical protein KIT25_15310 [Enhydrobacter sp.]
MLVILATAASFGAIFPDGRRHDDVACHAPSHGLKSPQPAGSSGARGSSGILL